MIEQLDSKLSYSDIEKLIPHRYPFLLIDKIIDIKKGNSIIAIKSVSGNEPFFPGHFPGFPIFPGVLIVEAMAQVSLHALLKLVCLVMIKIHYFI